MNRRDMICATPALLAAAAVPASGAPTPDRWATVIEKLRDWHDNAIPVRCDRGWAVINRAEIAALIEWAEAQEVKQT